MPKKTKREKKMADRRRDKMDSSLAPAYLFRAEPLPVRTVSHPPMADLLTIRQDLIKTVVLAMIAITIEVLLSRIIR